ncbi:MAG TPA: HDOD domain-containing protein [Cycloclasticus sp.]|jgi:HD-like signal output (HDOD) protein|nr:HDOD domain-containing protein [Cycloclasticus sp.]HIL92440.1 HDOD domain-containing protein [Cycloclasticus sp.]
MPIRNLSAEELNTLFPIRNFSETSKAQLQDTVQTEDIAANEILFASGDNNDRQIYLLEGKIKLSIGENKERVIEGGEIEARFLIDNNTPHQATAVALSPVTILSIQRTELDNLMNERTPSRNNATVGILKDGEDSLLYNQLYFEVTQEMQADKLELPSIPETAVKVRKAISDLNITSDKISKIALQDPAITAQLIKVANSPLFRGREKIEALPPAVTRLGLKAISNLITSFTMRMVFNTKTKDLKNYISTLWLHSRDVAAISAVMAKKLKGFDTDKAMLIGLVHDIGSIPILTHADKHPNLTSDTQEVQQTLTKLTPILGKRVLEKWNFTEDFIDVAVNAENWERKTNQPANYTDLIIVAQLLSFRNTPLQEKYPEPSSVPAYERLTKLLKDPEYSIDVLENSQEELSEIKNLFN